MSDVIPFACGIGLLGIFTIYQVCLSYTYDGHYKDKIYYYCCHLITIIPLFIYIYAIINIYILNTPLPLSLFYIDWTITTPLSIITIGRFLKIPVKQHILLTICDLTMILSGYISYASKIPIVIYSTFGVGSLCFVILMASFITKLKPFQKPIIHSLPPTSIYRDSARYRFFKVLVGIVVCAWPLYPISHILLKEGIITPYIAEEIYVTVDVLSKGLFTTVLLASKEIHRNGTSLLGRLTKKVFKIHPLTHTLNETHIESLEQILTITPFVPSPPTPPNPPTPPIPSAEPSKPFAQTAQTAELKQPTPSSTSSKRVAYRDSVGLSTTSSHRSVTVYAPTMESINEESLA